MVCRYNKNWGEHRAKAVLETAVQGEPLGQGLSILAVLLCLANITFMTEQNKDIYMRK